MNWFRKSIALIVAFNIILFLPAWALENLFQESTMLLKIGSSKAFIGGTERRIDPTNHRVVPVVQEGRTLLPVRFVAENFGAKVTWVAETQTAKIQSGEKTALIQLGNKEMQLNGSKIPLDVPATLIDNRTYIPLRRLAEDVLEKQVTYEDGMILLSEAPISLTEGSLKAQKPFLKDNMGRLSYIVYYGPATTEFIQEAKGYELVILHPLMGDWTRDQVAEIQRGMNPYDTSDDVWVLGYISIGEDLRTASLMEEELNTDPRFKGDGTGPRVDPRGPVPDGGKPLPKDQMKGNPSPGGSGFASYYLDDNDFDGLPDRNTYFNGAFVNAGDPAWFDTINGFTMDSIDRLPGLREILSLDYGRGLGCDGVFLDTIDTCAPNSYTNEKSSNQSEFEWTAQGFSAFIKRLRQEYPEKYILQNRGLFFFDSRLPHYEFTTREDIDFLMFESYMLDSNEEYNHSFYQDNKNAVMPKVMAAANLPDGFRVLSLGYAAGNSRLEATLRFESQVGLELFQQDIYEAEEIAGFNHFISDPGIISVNHFVREMALKEDHNPPIWSSTYNDSIHWPPNPPKARQGLQSIVTHAGGATLLFDVALDKNRVEYTAYYQQEPFDFSRDPDLTKAQKKVLFLKPSSQYKNGSAPNTYPYEGKIEGLLSGETYYFILRAKDHSPSQNEEKNQNVLSVRIP